jgi:Cu2+-exporting ATPase
VGGAVTGGGGLSGCFGNASVGSRFLCLVNRSCNSLDQHACQGFLEEPVMVLAFVLLGRTMEARAKVRG